VTYPTPTTEKLYPTPTQPVTYPTPTTEKPYPTPTQPVTYPTSTTEKSYPTPTQPVTYPTPTTEKPYPTPTQPVTYPTPTTEKPYPTPTQPVTYPTPTTEKTYPTPTQAVIYPTPTPPPKTYPTPTQAITTLSTSPIPVPQCPIDEQHVTLNYADTVQGSSQLMFFVLLPDHSMFDANVTWALQGSQSWLPLPTSQWNSKPMKLIIRRSTDASSPLLGVASVSLSVLYARRVIVDVYDPQRQVAARHAVSTTSSIGSSSSTIDVAVVLL